MSEQVYFARSSDRIKIGTSRDAAKRIAALSIANPHPIEIIATFEGGRDLERALHRRLKKHCAKNEWFFDCAEVREVIDELKAKGGAHFIPIGASDVLDECDEEERERQIECIEASLLKISVFRAQIEMLKRLGAPREKLLSLLEIIEYILNKTSLAKNLLKRASTDGDLEVSDAIIDCVEFASKDFGRDLHRVEVSIKSAPSEGVVRQ